MGLTAVVRDSAPLRCAPRGEPLTEKNRRKAHNPLDYPHRRCSAWLANQPLRQRSNDATSWNRHRIAYQMLACPALQERTNRLANPFTEETFALATFGRRW